ncbi:Fructose-1,6-bisphosphatase [Corchorus olitorius]|uniref:Fructose-1,6-bisphosphatase n=1 Tax=Corchorus olitorius TaxID=93759 RepID=A0A1R3G3V8_9ROSI|nr:Fructose-1,6-bisphosphatase [Corchorus olitorius]
MTVILVGVEWMPIGREEVGGVSFWSENGKRRLEVSDGNLFPSFFESGKIWRKMIQQFVEIRLRRTRGKVAELYRAGTRDPLEKKNSPISSPAHEHILPSHITTPLLSTFGLISNGVLYWSVLAWYYYCSFGSVPLDCYSAFGCLCPDIIALLLLHLLPLNLTVLSY